MGKDVLSDAAAAAPVHNISCIRSGRGLFVAAARSVMMCA